MSYHIKEWKREKLKSLFLQGFSIRECAREVGVHRVTANSVRRSIIQPIKCPCGRDAGHRPWCWWRLERSPRRIEFLKKWLHKDSILIGSAREIYQRKKVPVHDILCYPYILGKPQEEYDLVLAVNEVVPKEIPEYYRSDLCQTVILKILEGQLSIQEVRPSLQRIIRELKRDYRPWREVSNELAMKFAQSRAS